MTQQRRTEPGQAAAASKYLGVGMTFGLATALFAYLGLSADRRFGTEPWLTLAGAFIGGGVGFYYMYYHLVIEPRQRASRHEGRDV